MTDKNDLMSLKTEVRAQGADDRDGGAAYAEAARQDNPPLLGWFAVGFAILGIFTFAPVFVPLGLILGVIALFIGQIGLGISAIFLSVIGVVTSPTLMAVVGIGAFFAWLGF